MFLKSPLTYLLSLFLGASIAGAQEVADTPEESSTEAATEAANDVDEETEPAAFYELPEFVVWESRVAREQPVSTFPMPISALTYEPQVDVQGRTISEAQADVSIRGGTFEQTGFNIGAAGLWDPQTGHYFAEIPVTPNMLTRPVVYTALDNALYGFNSTAGSVEYNWLPIAGSTAAITGGAGNNGLVFGSAYGSALAQVPDSQWQVGVDAETAGSSASGPEANYTGSEFVRYNGRIQLLGPQSQTDAFFGYQSKQFGWPQMYVSTATFNEQENIQTNLFALNHTQRYGDADYVEVSAYARRNKDYYVLEQSNPSIFNAQHQTWAYSGAVNGRHDFNELFIVRYSSQYLADTINSSNLFAGPPYRTAGTGDGVYSESLYKLTVLPERTFHLASTWDLTVQAGGTLDYSNRHGSAGSPLGGLTAQQVVEGGRNLYYASFAKTTQVPTGTATGASPLGGLFRGNPGLGRENANNYEIGIELERGTWQAHTALFYRQDKHLTDWVYSTAVPAARFATPVDVDTLGVEVIGTKSWEPVDLILGYTYLNKDFDYSVPGVNASFYGGNYARHRITAAVVWRILDQLELRSDNEYRVQAPNALRRGVTDPVLSSLGLYWFPPQVPELEVALAVDNLFNQAYEEVPGVPAYGRQFSASAAIRF